MKTLICIIENHPANKSTFGSILSKQTGIPLFDLKQYLTKYANAPGGTGEQKALDELEADMSIKETAILDHTGTTTALKVSQNFDRKIIFFSQGQNNSLAYRCFKESKHEPGIKSSAKKGNYTGLPKYMADNIKKMKPDLVIGEWHGSVEYLVGRIEQQLRQK